MAILVRDDQKTVGFSLQIRNFGTPQKLGGKGAPLLLRFFGGPKSGSKKRRKNGQF